MVFSRMFYIKVNVFLIVFFVFVGSGGVGGGCVVGVVGVRVFVGVVGVVSVLEVVGVGNEAGRFFSGFFSGTSKVVIYFG